MAGITLDKGKRIYSYGQPMTALHLIAKGKVQAEYPGGTYQLVKGDVIGICEICSEIHFIGYTALEEVSLLSYPVNSMEALEELLQKHPDVARVFVLSLFRQINTLMAKSALSEVDCAGLYQRLMEDYENYISLCGRYRVRPKTLENLDEIHAYLDEESADTWLNSYYLGLQHIYTGEHCRIMIQEPGLSMGMLRKGSLDFRKTYTLLDEMSNYRQQISKYYFSETGSDLFELYTSLYYLLGSNSEEACALFEDISRMVSRFENDCIPGSDKISSRIAGFRQNIALLSAPDEKSGKEDASNETILSELAGSLNTILEFAGLDSDAAASFRRLVNAYKSLDDKTSMDDDCCRLRKKLTAEFYTVYSAVFERAVSSASLPAPVKMFLCFGYVDEELSGGANSITLYKLAGDMANQSQFGVYTFYDWLLAIYKGSKNPSRNEFDEDFLDYVHKLQVSKNITAAQAAAMQNDPMERVRYELQNMFPSVNKITHGRPTTFCPIFSADNVLKDLNASYVTVSKISKALEMIRNIDYSAFYRESLDYDNIEIMGKETIHLEYLPDVILAPNAGIRGIMWQEIEGKKRNSPSRMIFSIFHMEDINTSMVRLTGEFRWELCKRVQGARWNDVTDRSLTSEYFDYIQFYRKNSELSNEAKEKVRTSLQRAKNSFKEMFVRDYIIWVLFEGAGSPRLNKVARRILFTYCPFPASLNDTLEQNPLYAELLSQRRIVSSRRVHHLGVFLQKLRNSNSMIPNTLEAEIKFAKGTIN